MWATEDLWYKASLPARRHSSLPTGHLSDASLPYGCRLHMKVKSSRLGGLTRGLLICKMVRAGGAENTWGGSPGGSRAVGLT